MDKNKEIAIYKSKDGKIELQVKLDQDNVWLNQKEMAALFGVESHTVTYHLKTIYKTRELSKMATTRKFRVVQTESGRKVQRKIDYFNLVRNVYVGLMDVDVFL